MKTLTDITEPLRSAIIMLDNIQKQFAHIPLSPENKEMIVKERLIHELITLNISAAENSLLGANTALVNMDSIDETTLQFAIDVMKVTLRNFNQPF